MSLTSLLETAHNGYYPVSGVVDFQVENLQFGYFVPKRRHYLDCPSTIDALSLDDICSYHGYLGTCVDDSLQNFIPHLMCGQTVTRLFSRSPWQGNIPESQP
ncbi:hypothetical protein TNCV_4179821 [Trichonephila clavipes]|nr:hypothetical protein TNCV_4179821 [Trichonephila clavipes]